MCPLIVNGINYNNIYEKYCMIVIDTKKTVIQSVRNVIYQKEN